MSKRWNLHKLQGYQRDLTDDSGEIRNINCLVDNLIEDFQDAVKSDNTGTIISKMNDLREPSEYNDSDVSNAQTYIGYEINELQREIEEEERRAREAAAAALKAALGGGST